MERDQLEDLDIDERIIANWIFKKWDGDALTGFAVAEDRYRWWPLANAVLNHCVPIIASNFLTS